MTPEQARIYDEAIPSWMIWAAIGLTFAAPFIGFAIGYWWVTC